MKDRISPVLRENGWRGSGQQFWLTNSQGTHTWIGFHRSRHNTRHRVQFAITVTSITQQEWLEIQARSESEAARKRPGNFRYWLGWYSDPEAMLGLKEEHWWRIWSQDDADAVAEEVVRLLEEVVFPYMQAKLTADELPTPPADWTWSAPCRGDLVDRETMPEYLMTEAWAGKSLPDADELMLLRGARARTYSFNEVRKVQKQTIWLAEMQQLQLGLVFPLDFVDLFTLVVGHPWPSWLTRNRFPDLRNLLNEWLSRESDLRAETVLIESRDGILLTPYREAVHQTERENQRIVLAAQLHPLLLYIRDQLT